MSMKGAWFLGSRKQKGVSDAFATLVGMTYVFFVERSLIRMHNYVHGYLLVVGKASGVERMCWSVSLCPDYVQIM